MALKWLTEAQRATAKVFGSIDRRVYIDPRKQEYPAIAGSASFTLVDDDASLLARWRMREASGVTIYDDSGNAANITIFGSGVSLGSGYLDLSGTVNGYVASPNLTWGTSWSFSCEINPDDITTAQRFLGGNTAGRPFLSLAAAGAGRLSLYWNDSTPAVQSISGTVANCAIGTWTRIVATHTGTTTRLYADGALIASSDSYDSFDYTAQALVLGKYTVGDATYPYNGKMRNVRAYNRALSSEEAIALSGNGVTNRPGSHYLSGGYGKYLLPLGNYVVVDVLAKPTSDIADGIKGLVSWYIDATHRFYVLTNAGSILVAFQDGGTARTLNSSPYLSNGTWQVYKRITAVCDLTTGTTAGSALYIDGASVDAVWNGNIDAKASNFSIAEIRSYGGTEGAADIAYFRIWMPSSAADLPTATDVANNFKTYKEEEVYFDLNGTATGRTRCNVTHAVRSVGLRKSRYGINQNTPNPVVATLALMNENGRFTDDQFASADFGADYYNGQASQAFLQYPCPVEIESWYDATTSAAHVETEFLGRTEIGAFARSTGGGDISMVTIEANDRSNEMARRRRSKSYSYSDQVLVGSAAASNSLLHTVCGLGTNREWYDFAANNGFENAAISATWASNAGASLSRGTSGPFMGTYDAELYYTGTSNLMQWVRFTGDKRIESGQNWTLSGYVKSTASATFNIGLSTRTSADAAVETISKANSYRGGSGWERLSVKLYVSATASVDRMRFYFEKIASGAWHVDGVQLVQNHEPLNWWWENNASGVAGLVDADDAVSDEYEIMGVDADEVAGTVPWALIPAGEPMWAHVSDIGHAALSRTCGVSPCGTFVLRSPLKSGYSDPSPLFTVSDGVRLGSIIDVEQANKLIVHGVYIITGASPVTVWSAESASVFASSIQGGKFREEIAAGDYFPDLGEFPEFYAKYEELK